MRGASETITGVVFNGNYRRSCGWRRRGAAHPRPRIRWRSRAAKRLETVLSLRTDVLGKHLLRVRHGGVILSAGSDLWSNFADLKYSTLRRTLAGVHETVTIMKIESNGRSLNVTELHSSRMIPPPPRTLANASKSRDPSLVKIDSGSVVVAGPSWRPEKVKA